jgi:hypothetical protein
VDRALDFTRCRPTITYYLAGLGLASLCFLLNLYWFELANDWLHLGVIYDTRPAWLVWLLRLLEWLPCVAAVGVFLLRVLKGSQFRAVAYTVGSATPYVLVISWVFFGPILDEAWHRQDFDSAAWIAQEGADTEWPARLRMVDDLLDEGRLRGLERDSVLALLGSPETTTRWPDWDIIYWLGPVRGVLRIDSEWLGIRFGSDGRVAATELLRD